MGIKTALLDLIRQGRLTGDGIKLDGHPLIDAPKRQWRDDGWSTETTAYGARNHRDIDAHIDKMLATRDQITQEVAEASPRFFAFHPLHEQMVSTDPAQAKAAAFAYSDIMVIAHWLGGSAGPWDFRLLASEHGIDGQHYYFPEGHGIVVGQAPALPKTWPQTYIKLLDGRVEAAKADPFRGGAHWRNR